MAKKEITTSKPTGLAITRDGQWFTIKWKIGSVDYNDGQQLQYHLSNQPKDKWTTVSIGRTTTSKSVQISKSNYYPTTSAKLTKVTFRIRGKREDFSTGTGDKKKDYTCSWSGWSTKEMTLEKPSKPSISAELDNQLTNVCRFTWNVNASSDNRKPYTSVEWQTRLAPKGSTVTDGSKLAWNSSKAGWGTGTSTSSSGTITRTEDTATLATGSFTRWVRVRARGVAGASEWVYSKHVYAKPYQAKITSASAKKVALTSYECKVTWTAASSAAHPIDSTTVQYAMEVPAAGVTCPDNATWTDANVSRDTSGKDTAVFKTERRLANDECLFVRVVTQHDSNVTYSVPKLVLKGALAGPSGLNVTTVDSTHRATITVTNNSQVSDSMLAVVYMPNKGSNLVVGIMPHGDTSITIQCPDWSSQSSFGFGVYAFVGTYKSSLLSSGVRVYTVTEKMTSSTITDGGDVPVAPTGVDAVIVDDETVKVDWNWNWSKATGAELSWADYENAWESTEQPEFYTVPDIYRSEWNIRNLELGKIWYIRIRFIVEETEGITYGPWSNTVQADLSYAPETPSLYLSDSVIKKDGKVTASWEYTSADGTQQSYAEICEATVGTNSITYGNIIAHTKTAHQVTIKASGVGWDNGETHNLCLRVTSASGKTSETWSDPVAVSIADPVTANISSTSLQNVVIVDDADEGTQRTVLSLTALPLSVTVTGAGNGGTTILAIERAADYHMERPDGAHVDGYEGETVFLFSQTGESAISVTKDALIGALDDGAQYRLVATVQDGFGQSASASMDFEVHWAHQAIIPEATVEIDEGAYVAKITPIAPTGAANDDVCDIYRLSADRPELIVKDGAFGSTYVDPYPAIGEFGGHRIVFKTANGDYITHDEQPAWIDLGEADDDILDIDYSIIDFDGNRLLLYYNVI